MLKLNFFLALSYFLGGYVGTLLAVPPSHASSIWPAAGIALAGIITYGNRVIPGIWLGAFFIQFYAFLDTANLQNIPTSLMIGGIVSVAATAQAALGAWLIKRYIGVNNPLIEDASILRFFALGGPLCCLITASIGITTLYLEGLISLNNLAFSWMTWWVGDVIGVLIFTPFLLCFIGAPRSQWRLRVNSVALPLLILLLLVAALFQLGKSQEQARLSVVFEDRTNLLHNVLQNKIRRQIEINQTLKAFFDSSTHVSHKDFKLFTQSIFAGHKSLLALEWIPRITMNNRSFYEQLLGPGFTIRVHDKPVQSRSEYFPVAYVEPFQGNERAFGFDVSINPMAYQAIQLARDSGLTIAAGITHLAQDPQNRPGTVIYSPIYEPHKAVNTLKQRRQNLRGFVASVLLTGNEVNKVKRQFDNLQVLLKITDGGVELLNETDDGSILELGFPALEKTAQLPFANRIWNVTYRAAPQFYQAQISWNTWWLILGCFLLTGLTGLGLLMLTGRTMQTEGVVKIRTQELENEIARRKIIIRQRNDHNKVLQAIASPALLPDILELIVHTAERNYPDSLCSILLVDEEGKHLYSGAAPSLPEMYKKATDGIPVSDNMDCCGTAAYKGQRVIIEDIFQHPYSESLVTLAKQAGLAACWSEPIFSSIQKVLGVFVVYHRTPHYPDAEMLTQINELAQLASIAIERKLSEEKITHLAFFDALTNLPNRRYFMANLEKALSSDTRHNTYGALLYLDLDHFKVLNDSLGHDIGDELLIQVANRLKQCIRDEDTVARLGGDEFVLLLSCREISQDKMLDHALTTAERVQTNLQSPYQLKEHIHHITPSIGITLMPHSNLTSGELLKQADTAMYHAKNRGRNTISFYNEDMQRHANQRLMLEEELREALTQQQFSLHYQPQFDLNNQLIGAEALLRWLHPQKGVISSTDFIHVAEETGLILLIGDWVIREACAQSVKWPDIPRLAINISSKQFRQYNFSQKIAATLAEYQIVKPRLTLEITESTIVENIDENIGETVEKLQILQNLGIEISIGNFGTSYCSPVYLKRLPLNQLKIDKSFVRDLNTDSGNAAIVEAILIMSRHLGLSVIAEGVETTEQMQFLRNNNCKGYQGYLFSDALTAIEFTRRFVKE
ncbi:MAG: EAL domain-containing protein [Methylococcales bacterium]|nr:EAL domain-containing protein [Methylococcales bacterium]